MTVTPMTKKLNQLYFVTWNQNIQMIAIAVGHWTLFELKNLLFLQKKLKKQKMTYCFIKVFI